MKHLRLAKDLTLPLDAVSRTFGILAVRGAGKSNTAAVMAEEMFAAGLPFVVIDPVGSWYGLRSSADGTTPGLPIPIFGGKHGDVPLERGSGELLADLIVEKRLTCVLDLSRADSESAKKQFLLAFAQRLYLKNENPLHLFLEEADDYIPQKPMRDEAQLLRAWENIVRRGRARGLGMTLITQRSAAVAKMVLTQVETLFAMRTTGPQDIAAIEAWVKYHQVGKDVLSTLSGLEDGEAWVWSPHYLKTMSRHQIRRRHTFDSGATPANLKAKDTRPPATLADIDLTALQERMAATIEKAKADDPRELRKQIATLRAEVAALNGRKPEAPKSDTGKTVTKQVLTDADRALLEKASVAIANAIGAHGDVANILLPQLGQQFDAAFERFSTRLNADIDKRNTVVVGVLESKGFQKILGKLANVQPETRRPADTRVPVGRSSAATRPTETRAPRVSDGSGSAGDASIGNSGLSRMLVALAQRPQGLKRNQLGLRAMVSTKGGSFNTYLSKARVNGWVDTSGDRIRLTGAGLAALGSYDPLPEGRALLDHYLRELGSSGAGRMLQVIAAAYPQALTREELSERSNVSAAGGSFNTYLSKLRTLELIEGRGELRASEELFS